MKAIAVDGLTCDYSGGHACSNELFAGCGRGIGFHGQNSAGKITALRRLMGFRRPDVRHCRYGCALTGLLLSAAGEIAFRRRNLPL